MNNSSNINSRVKLKSNKSAAPDVSEQFSLYTPTKGPINGKRWSKNGNASTVSLKIKMKIYVSADIQVQVPLYLRMFIPKKPMESL